ncbi:MAG: hypothetical protein J6X85_07185, partial [Ruminococcus sp.]|nr:hypothetical protein [Ruminococcus sp.]
KLEFYLSTRLANGTVDERKTPVPNNVYRNVRHLPGSAPIDNNFDFSYTGKPLYMAVRGVFYLNETAYPLDSKDFYLENNNRTAPAVLYSVKLYADGKNTVRSNSNNFIEDINYSIVLDAKPAVKVITNVKGNKYQVKYNRQIKNENCYVQIKVTEYDENGKKLGYTNYSIKDPKVNGKNFYLKYSKTASIGVKVRYVTYYQTSFNAKSDYTYGKWTSEKKYQIKEVTETVDISKT